MSNLVYDFRCPMQQLSVLLLNGQGLKRKAVNEKKIN